MTLRKIEAIDLREIKPQPPQGPQPKLLWIAPTALLVDEGYQRGLSKESYRLIRKLAANFAWCRMKPPIVVEVERGWHVIDGQHTAIAAASIGLKEIPVFAVTADTAEIRAAAFVGHNSDRMRVSPVAIYRALVIAKDPDALDVANVCQRAGVRVRIFNKASAVAEGDTMAIGSLRALIKSRGVRRSRILLEALRRARLAPISAHHIRAADLILHKLSPTMPAEVLTDALKRDEFGLDEAMIAAARQKKPVRDVLAARWVDAISKNAIAKRPA